MSASGPESSKYYAENGELTRSRMAADLGYTTADVDFLYDHFLEPESDRPRIAEQHRRLVNPTRAELLAAFDEAEKWLASHRDHDDWDGGGIHLNYAGHGSEDGGAFVLEDGVFSVDEYLDRVHAMALNVSAPGRLRLAFVLDSCHSGDWVLRVLEDCLYERGEELVAFNLFASCMPDEYSYEDSSLGQGVFTYTFSVRPDAHHSIGATSLAKVEGKRPSLSIARNEAGCSLLTGGWQNPLAYWNGGRWLQVSHRGIQVFDRETDEPCFREADVQEAAFQLRDNLRELTQVLLGEHVVMHAESDDEMRQKLATRKAEIEELGGNAFRMNLSTEDVLDALGL